MKVLAVLALCVIAVLARDRADSEFGPTGHWAATAGAIKLFAQYCTGSPVCAQVKAKATTALGVLQRVLGNTRLKAHSGLGVDIKTKSNSNVHWDCELIEGGSKAVLAAVNRFIAGMKANPSCPTCFGDLSQVLHTCGDFFAHTNFLELLINMGVSDTDMNAIIKAVPEVTEYAESGKFTAAGTVVQKCALTQKTCGPYAGFYGTGVKGAIKRMISKTPPMSLDTTLKCVTSGYYPDCAKVTPAGKCEHDSIALDEWNPINPFRRTLAKNKIRTAQTFGAAAGYKMLLKIAKTVGYPVLAKFLKLL